MTDTPDIEPKTGMETGRGNTILPSVSNSKGERTAKSGQKLTLLQQRFCAEYVKDMNGTQAATRAGYAPKNAAITAAKLLKSSKIQAALADFRRELAADLKITPERVLREWAEIGFGNVADFIDDEGRVDLSKPTRAQKGTISEITTETYMEGHGEEAETVKRVKLKFHSKTQALDALSKHLGLFERDNEQKGLGAFMEFLSGVSSHTNRTDS